MSQIKPQACDNYIPWKTPEPAALGWKVHHFIKVAFLNEHPKIQEVYSKKPIYCYRIDRQQLTEKDNMSCIGKIPGKGTAGELIIMYKEGYLYEGEVVDGIR